MKSDRLRTIEFVAIEDLKTAPRNARTHSKRQIKQITASMKRFGFTNPLLIDDQNEIVAGHGRLAAAKDAGISDVPCVRIGDMSAVERRAYMIADNRLAENAGWDKEILAIEFQGLIADQFDVGLTGFELGEIDIILFDADHASPDPDEPDDDHPPPGAQAVTRLGDLWVLGRHALLCGNARDKSAIDLVMADRRADMIFTDPPYNVKIDGHVCGCGKTHHREFVEASGELSQEEFTKFLFEALSMAASVCRDGAIADVCMDWRHLREVQAAGYAAFSSLKNICVWNKTNGGMGTFYRSQHELVLIWKVGTAPHTNTFGLGDKGRYRTNVWSYPGVNTFKSGRMEDLGSHPTVKPVALVADAIRDVTNRGELVLDVFGGSGTTLIAAEKTGRCARLVELDPIYCDVIIRRWERLTGKQAKLVGADETFECISAARMGCSQTTTSAGGAQ